MTERQSVIQKVVKLRRLAADPGATPSESTSATKMAEKLTAQWKLTASEVAEVKAAPETPASYSAFAAAFVKAGFKPSKQARGDLSGN